MAELHEQLERSVAIENFYRHQVFPALQACIDKAVSDRLSNHFCIIPRTTVSSYGSCKPERTQGANGGLRLIHI